MAKGGFPTGGYPQTYLCDKCGRLYSTDVGTCVTDGCGGTVIARKSTIQE